MESKRKQKVNPERQSQRFSAEFKREAVRMLELGQKPATHLRKRLLMTDRSSPASYTGKSCHADHEKHIAMLKII